MLLGFFGEGVDELGERAVGAVFDFVPGEGAEVVGEGLVGDEFVLGDFGVVVVEDAAQGVGDFGHDGGAGGGEFG